MSDTPYTATAGPADPNAGTRAKIYSSLKLITPLIGLAATFGLLTQDQVSAVNGAIAAGTTLLGAFGLFGFGLAAKNTKTQLNNGTFDAAPQLPAVSALEQMVILRDQAAQEVDKSVSNAKAGADAIQAMGTAVAKSLGVPTVVTDMGNAGFDAVQALIDRERKQ